MGGQDEEDFQQRHAEYQDHHDGDRAENLAKGAGDEEQGCKGRHSRQNTDGHRAENALYTSQGCRWVDAVFFLLGDDVFTNHDSIVDDDTQHDNQRE